MPRVRMGIDSDPHTGRSGGTRRLMPWTVYHLDRTRRVRQAQTREIRAILTRCTSDKNGFHRVAEYRGGAISGQRNRLNYIWELP